MMFSQQLHPVVLTLDMNYKLKHIVCFISSEISMYLTEIPELSANCMYSVVNVDMIVNQLDVKFYSFQH